MSVHRSILVLSLFGFLLACSGSSEETSSTATSSEVEKEKTTCLARAKSDTCAVCGCNTCLDAITKCYGDPSCETIVECGRAKGCRGLACYEDKTCKTEIDGAGGPTGQAAIKASTLSNCTTTKCKACDIP